MSSRFVVQIEVMAPHARINGGDSHAAGRGRQHLKLAAIGYADARHGLDSSEELLRGALMFLCQKAIDFVATLPNAPVRSPRVDLQRGDHDALRVVAIAYASARHGIDADVGMAREGLAVLCQAAIDYVESLPKEDVLKRSASVHLHLGNGA